jgi:SAM-dependent methyltransferase
MPHLSREKFSPTSLTDAQFTREKRESTNEDVLSDYALSVNLDTIHPARLFAVRAALHESIQQGQLPEVELLERAFFRTLSQAKKIIPDYKYQLCNNDYSKAELLEALNFTILTPASIEKFYSYIISPELFTSSGEVQRNDPEIPSHCFDFVSFCPKSIIHAIAGKGADSMQSFHDLGCGPGSIMFIVATLTEAQVFGTELSSAMCKKGVAFAQEISRKDIEFINRDLEDSEYSFKGYQYYYCYSPFIWKLEEAYLFAQKVTSSVIDTKGELWMGDYLPLREIVEEEGALQKVAEYNRLAVYREKG